MPAGRLSTPTRPPQAIPAAPHADFQDHAIAGFGAGTVATLVMHPLDLVKVRFQLADASAPKHRFGRALYDVLAESVRADGWRGLYRGLVPNLVGGASSWGLYFLLWVGSSLQFGAAVCARVTSARAHASVLVPSSTQRPAPSGRARIALTGSYHMIKKEMQGGDPTYRTSAGQHLLAAAEASAITAMLTNPIWVVKTRVFATPRNDPNAYSGLVSGSLWRRFLGGVLLLRLVEAPTLSAAPSQRIALTPAGSLKRIYGAEGWRGLYRGSLLALVGVSNGSIQFAAYEDLKRRRIEAKRRKFAERGLEWKAEDEKLVSTASE